MTLPIRSFATSTDRTTPPATKTTTFGSAVIPRQSTPGYLPIPADAEDADDDGNLTEPTPDLNGHHRIVGAITDKGPFETGCEGDIDNNLTVDVTDLFLLLSNWGACTSCPPHCAGDLTGSSGLPDCNIDVNDLFLLLASWGDCQTGQGQVPQSVSDCLNWYEAGSQEQLACLEAFQKLQEE